MSDPGENNLRARINPPIIDYVLVRVCVVLSNHHPVPTRFLVFRFVCFVLDFPCTRFLQVHEQELMVTYKLLKVFDEKPMYYMRELDNLFSNQAT